MVLWALESVQGLTIARIVFVVLKEHEERFGIRKMLSGTFQVPTEFVFLDQVTEGQLCTVLAARDWIDRDEDVLIASADTWVRSNMAEDIHCQPEQCQGVISVANLPGDRWSFARTNAEGNVVEVTEKVRISNHASTGLYYFRNGRQFVEAGEEMVRNREKTRGEYYVIPVYQKYIKRGWTVKLSQAEEVWDMGTPEGISEFEKCHLGII